MSQLELNVYDIFKARFNEEDARTLIEYIETKTEEGVNKKRDPFLTKCDKIDIAWTIYSIHIIQFLATIGSMIAIFYFINK